MSKLAPRIGFAKLALLAPVSKRRSFYQNRKTQSETWIPTVSGGDLEEATPDPIPNSEVKLFGADGTAREAVWESRTLPGFTTAMAYSHS